MSAWSLAIPDALRAGALSLAASRPHVSFWNLVYDEPRWHEERSQAYPVLVLPTAADAVLDKLRQDYADIVARVGRGLAGNPFATMRDGRLPLKRPAALAVSERTKPLRRVLATSLPR